MIRTKSNKFRPFIPDFSLRVSEDVQILRIRRVHWLAAVRATYSEKKQTANGDTPMLNSAGQQIDLLTQELEKVDDVEPTNATASLSGGLRRERTSSLALTIASDGGAEQEKLLGRHSSSSTTNYAHSTLEQSDRNTPILAQNHRVHLLRSQNNSPATASTVSLSSLSNTDESLAKNRSLT